MKLALAAGPELAEGVAELNVIGCVHKDFPLLGVACTKPELLPINMKKQKTALRPGMLVRILDIQINAHKFHAS